MISVAKRMSAWTPWLRAGSVLVIAAVAQGFVYASIEAGVSAEIFTVFVLVLFFCGLLFCLHGNVMLTLHRRRLARLPSEVNGNPLGTVVASLEDDSSPFVGVLRDAHEQYIRCPAAVDTDTLIELLEDRLYRAGPQRLSRTVSLVITAGFLGTCFGMLMAMNGVSAVAALAGSDSQSMNVGLLGPAGPLSAMGGSYLSTLAALACGSVVLRALGHVQEDAVADLVAEFRELVSVYVKPSFGGGGAGA